ncbi:MAG: hypothetical protein J1E64_10950 [Acetatifactor sp.]|nr:hypothetical protein [Acetatifactor sp.]
MKIKQSMAVAGYNFRQWHKNSRIILTFFLSFILCFLLSDKAVQFAEKYDTTMQILEPFIWTFGDSNSILLSSLMLLLLFADMPFISSGTPFYLVRIDRKTWLLGQSLYIVAATFIYLVFVLLSTSFICMRQSFVGNMWSETAAILGYSGIGQTVALPAFVKTLEMSTPYKCTAAIFMLMLLYTLMLASVMLLFRLRSGQLGGMISVLAFSLYGFLLNPQTLQTILGLRDYQRYQANVAVGWLSPLNHATYHMHNFGYDLLPRIWQTCLFFVICIVLLFYLSFRAVRKFNFHFTGTEA